MKRFLCILLCLLLAAPAAFADNYTPTKLFRQQFITGGNGLRGTVSVTASGVADWLDLLVPFAGTKLQVRIIGERQGSESALVTDDEDWQVKLWAKDAQGGQQGMTRFFGSPEGILMESELLPDVLLNLPVKGVNLPYQLTDGAFLQLFEGFDPLKLTTDDNGGNASAWSAMMDIAAIDEAVWAESWAPVLLKYETAMDMWLAEYASPTVVSGGAGSMTLRTSYDIPAEDLKAQAKYIVKLMLVDGDLQRLASPYMTDAQRSLYFNPAMAWFYDHCIDVTPLTGSIMLERETTSLGETTAMTISLPLPPLPAELTDAVGDMLSDAFGLPYRDALAGVERISIRQAGGDLSVSLTSPKRTVSFIIDEQTETEESLHLGGFLRITPAVGVEEPPLSAAFTFKSTQRIWEDEEYNTHEDLAWTVEVMPDLGAMAEDDPFLSTYVDFAPMSFSASLGFIKKEKVSSPVQLSVQLDMVMKDAEVGVAANLRTAERWEHDPLPEGSGENLLAMTDARREELRAQFVANALSVMTTLNATAADAQ